MKSILKRKRTISTLIICIIFLTFFTSIAYSAISSTMTLTGIAYSRVEADARITNFSLKESLSSTSYYEEFSKDTIKTEVNIPVNNSIKYNLEITNYGTSNIGIYSITGLPEGLSYSIENYNLKDMICNDAGKCNTLITKTLQLKIYATETSYQGTINLQIDIRPFHNITYTNFTGNYVSYVIDGDSINIDLSTDSPTFVDVKSKSNLSYSYLNNILNINNVTDDVEIIAITSEFNYDYTGDVQTFVAEYDGTYRIETWGASGGNVSDVGEGGYGSYSTGTLEINKGETFYLYIGGEGESNYQGSVSIAEGGYNGGGSAGHDGNTCWAAGGGATHIATVSGLLSTLEQYKNQKELIIVSAGGGGAGWFYASSYPAYIGGAGGGNVGADGSGHLYGAGGTQTSGGSYKGTNSSNLQIISGTFGQGSSNFVYESKPVSGGGGGGYYGGGSGYTYGSSAAGGSGYIGNEGLIDKYMMCYNCGTSDEINTKTQETTCASENPVPDCTKKGNGYAKITMIQFGIIHNIKYTNIDGEYQNTINNGSDLIVDFGDNAPKNIDVLLDGEITTEYTYADGILKISNVTSDIEIIRKEEYIFDYTGSEQYFQAPQTGIYKLETWGAQGGSNKTLPGGYGAYAVGNIELSKQDTLYINVGGAGKSAYINGAFLTTTSLPHTIIGGYNGGGNDIHTCETIYGTSGGGATHIASVSGQLSLLEQYKDSDKILIVSGGGGGSSYWDKDYTNSDGTYFPVGQSYQGGSGGGITGTNSQGSSAHMSTIFTFYGGNQTSAGDGIIYTNPTDFSIKNSLGSFGQGGSGRGAFCIGAGGGGGWYGGTGGYDNSAGAGGSGYIGNSLLTNKYMTCYNCEVSNETSSKTSSTTCTSETATADCAKIGNGYAKITLLEIK